LSLSSSRLQEKYFIIIRKGVNLFPIDLHKINQTKPFHKIQTSRHPKGNRAKIIKKINQITYTVNLMAYLMFFLSVHEGKEVQIQEKQSQFEYKDK